MPIFLKYALLYFLLPLIVGIICNFLLRALLYSITSKNYYFKHIEKALDHGFVEKDLSLREGLHIHYAEGPKNGIPLLLLPGQGSIWQDYGPVLLDLASTYHVVAVDCHGHGKSSWNKKDYRIQQIADDFAVFIKNVFDGPAVVAGHSSGGLITACLAARHPSLVRGIILEDPPFFTTEPGRKENTYVWVDTFKNIDAFLKQDEEKDYLCYYMPRSYWKRYFGKLWKVFTEKVIKQRKENPTVLPYIPWAGTQINRIWESLAHPYDLQFSVGFIDDSFFENFSHEETLKKIQCPSLFIKATTRYDKKQDLLLAALNEEDCKRVHDLLPANRVVHVRSGHDVHFEKPRVYSNNLIAFSEVLK